jgi:hypothetical protein
MPSKPSQWTSTSVPDSVKWNRSGGLADAAVAKAIAATEQALKVSPASVLAPMRAGATSETIGAWAGRF